MTQTFFNHYIDLDTLITRKTWPDVEIKDTDGFYIAWDDSISSIDIYFIKINANALSKLPVKSLRSWFNTLTDSQIEAGIQIFYDRWNFCTGSSHDKRMCEIFQTEKNRRLAARVPKIGDVSCSPDNGMKVFDGTRWIEIATSEVINESIDT